MREIFVIDEEEGRDSESIIRGRSETMIVEAEVERLNVELAWRALRIR